MIVLRRFASQVVVSFLRCATVVQVRLSLFMSPVITICCVKCSVAAAWRPLVRLIVRNLLWFCLFKACNTLNFQTTSWCEWRVSQILVRTGKVDFTTLAHITSDVFLLPLWLWCRLAGGALELHDHRMIWNTDQSGVGGSGPHSKLWFLFRVVPIYSRSTCSLRSFILINLERNIRTTQRE